MPPIFVYMGLRLFSEGIARTRPVPLISLLGLVVDVLANYALIFGRWGFPPMGARLGCGIATALGMDDAGGYGRHDVFGYPLSPLWVVSAMELAMLAELRPLLVLGLPIGIGLF